MKATDRATRHDRADGRRYPYPSSPRELLLHATILAIALWGAVCADVVGRGTLGRFSNVPKGNDFLQFYASGRLAGAGRFDALVDDRQFRAAQEPFLGHETPVSYPAVYPPQIGLVFAPLSWLPYSAAYFVWSVLTMTFVAVALFEFDTDVSLLTNYRAAALMTALAFAPLPYLVLAGQLSAVAMFALAVVHRGLRRGSSVLAGAGLGLLAFKPSLFLPAIAVCLLAGDMRVTLAAAVVAVAQTMCVIPVTGSAVVSKAMQNILAAARHPDVLVMRPYLMVSWRTFWALLVPQQWVTPFYALSAGGTLVITARAWRRCRDPLTRVGLLSLAVVLAAPHVFLYDLVIIAPACVLACRTLLTRHDTTLYAATVCAFLCPLTIPGVAWVHLQWCTLVLFVWWVTLL